MLSALQRYFIFVVQLATLHPYPAISCKSDTILMASPLVTMAFVEQNGYFSKHGCEVHLKKRNLAFGESFD
jgi:hypothetical protein